MLRIILLLAMSAGAADFCRVEDNGGFEQCWYYSASECQRVVARSGGFCVYKSDRSRGSGFNLQIPAIDPSILNRPPQKSVLEGAVDGYEQGLRIRGEKDRQKQARELVELEKQKVDMQQGDATNKEILFRAELKAKAIEFAHTNPSEENPYLEALRAKESAAATAQANRSYAADAALEAQIQDSRRRSSNTKIALGVVAVLGLALLLAN